MAPGSISTTERIRTSKGQACLTCHDSKLRCERPAATERDAMPKCMRCCRERLTSLPRPYHSSSAITSTSAARRHRSPRAVLATHDAQSHLELTDPPPTTHQPHNTPLQPFHPLQATPIQSPYSTAMVPQKDAISAPAAFVVAPEHRKLFFFFQDHMRHHTPFISTDRNWAAPEQCKAETPYLFLAILCVAAGASSSPLKAALHMDLRRVIAQQVMVEGKKTLELLQVLLLSAFWYAEEETWSRSRWTSLLTQLSCLAYDLELESIHCTSHQSTDVCTSSGLSGCLWATESKLISFQDAMQQMRVFVFVHGLLTNAAVCLRRLDLLRMPPSVAEYVKILEALDDEADRDMMNWYRLDEISYEAATQLHLLETAARTSPSDQPPYPAEAASSLFRRLDDWMASCTATGTTEVTGSSVPSLPEEQLPMQADAQATVTQTFYHHVVYTRILEPYLGSTADSDIRPPFGHEIRPPKVNGAVLDLALSHLTRSLDLLCRRSVLDMRCAPVLTFAALCYLVTIFIRCVLSSEAMTRVQKSELVSQHTSGVIAFLESASNGPGQALPHCNARLFGGIIERLVQRFEKSLLWDESSPQQGQLPPLKHAGSVAVRQGPTSGASAGPLGMNHGEVGEAFVAQEPYLQDLDMFLGSDWNCWLGLAAEV